MNFASKVLSIKSSCIEKCYKKEKYSSSNISSCVLDLKVSCRLNILSSIEYFTMNKDGFSIKRVCHCPSFILFLNKFFYQTLNSAGFS